MKAFQKKITRVAETPDAVVFMGPEREVDRWIEPPPAGKILMLAPHPDDGEAVGVTLKIFAEAGCEVFYIIACLSPGAPSISIVTSSPSSTTSPLPLGASTVGSSKNSCGFSDAS